MIKIDLRRGGLIALIAIFMLLTFEQHAPAQKKDCKPGEKIEYLAGTYPKEVWEVGTFVEASSSGRQPIIREKPSEFFKEGFQRGSQWAEIRPLQAKRTTANNEQKTEVPENNEKTAETSTDYGTGLMSRDQVLSFLQTKLGDKPFDNYPRLEAAKKELVAMVKQRGVDFRDTEVSQDYWSKLSRAGGNMSDVTFPLRDNYGAPTKESWLIGSWNLGKIGAAVDYTRNNRVYRQGEIGVGNVGTLTLNAGGTYAWKAGAKDSTSGKWRKATVEEMMSAGGDGIVLLKAKGGEDWIVLKDRITSLKGDWINIYQLNWRQIKEYGSRR